VLSSWPQAIARVHSIHLMNAEQRTSGLQPSDQATWLGLPVGNYRLQPPSPFIIITQPESWYSFTVPRRVEGWVDLGTVGRVHTARAQGCKSQWFLRWTQLPAARFDPRTSRTAVRHAIATARPLRPAYERSRSTRIKSTAIYSCLHIRQRTH